MGAPANQPGHVGEEKNPCPMYETQPVAGRSSALLGYKPTKKSKKMFERVQRTLFYKVFRLCQTRKVKRNNGTSAVNEKVSG